MGCDIHCYVEHRNPKYDREHWSNFGERINPGRNYLMFGYLAGVRHDGPPVVAPRGIPDKLGWAANDDYWQFISYDGYTGENYCTPETAERYHKHGSRYRGEVAFSQSTHYDAGGVATVTDNKQHVGKPQWVEHPDWHTPSWLTADEFEAAIEAYKRDDKRWGDPVEYRAVLAAMRALESGGNEVRLVFWFDN